jgi:AraC family transcriptional regulator of arabinose operon
MNRPQKGEGFPGQRIVVLPRKVIALALQQPALRGLLPTDIGFFPHAAGHLRERTRGVDQAILIYCTEGSGWCELNGQRRLVQRGELLAIPPGVSHAYGADEKTPWSILWVHAAGENLGSLLDELGVSLESPLLFVGHDPQLLILFEEVIATIEHGYTPSHLLYASRALTHLLGLMIWHRQQKWRDTPEPRQKVVQSIAYMKGHLNHSLTVSTLAALANLSSSHYSALFKRQTGYAPIDYFIRLRIHQACQLLDNTDMSVKEIAAALGYEDAFYCSRVFKLLNDISPRQYRMLHKG